MSEIPQPTLEHNEPSPEQRLIIQAEEDGSEKDNKGSKQGVLERVRNKIQSIVQTGSLTSPENQTQPARPTLNPVMLEAAADFPLRTDSPIEEQLTPHKEVLSRILAESHKEARLNWLATIPELKKLDTENLDFLSILEEVDQMFVEQATSAAKKVTEEMDPDSRQLLTAYYYLRNITRYNGEYLKALFETSFDWDELKKRVQLKLAVNFSQEDLQSGANRELLEKFFADIDNEGQSDQREQRLQWLATRSGIQKLIQSINLPEEIDASRILLEIDRILLATARKKASRTESSKTSVNKKFVVRQDYLRLALSQGETDLMDFSEELQDRLGQSLE